MQLQIIEYKLTEEIMSKDESTSNPLYDVANRELDINKSSSSESTEQQDLTTRFFSMPLALIISEQQSVSFLFFKHVLDEDDHVLKLWGNLSDHLSQCLRSMIPFTCSSLWWKAGWQEHAFTINDFHKNNSEVKSLTKLMKRELSIIDKENPSNRRNKLEVGLKNNDTTRTFAATANSTATTPTIDGTEKKQAAALAVTESTPPK